MKNALRQYRELAGWSREAEAVKVGCSASMVQILEAGARPVQSKVLRKIAAALSAELGVHYQALLTEVEGPRNGEAPAVQAEASQTSDPGGASENAV